MIPIVIKYISCGHIRIRAGEPEPGVFGSLDTEREPLEKNPGAGAAWEKNQEPEPLEKKSRAGAAKIFAGSPALVHIDG